MKGSCSRVIVLELELGLDVMVAFVFVVADTSGAMDSMSRREVRESPLIIAYRAKMFRSLDRRRRDVSFSSLFRFDEF